MSERGRLRVCAGASAGGHLSQLLRLSSSWADCDVFYMTTLPMVSKTLEQSGRTYVIGECNRRHPLRALAVLWRALRAIRKEKPDAVITTGSMPMALACLAAKAYGARIVWIDSITNVGALSMSGRLARRFADLCLTQWPHLSERYRGVEYAGTII